MTEQLFIPRGTTAPDGAVFLSTDTLAQRGRPVTEGERYAVNWRILGLVIKAAGRPVRLVVLNSGVHAYTLVA